MTGPKKKRRSIFDGTKSRQKVLKIQKLKSVILDFELSMLAEDSRPVGLRRAGKDSGEVSTNPSTSSIIFDEGLDVEDRLADMGDTGCDSWDWVLLPQLI